MDFLEELISYSCTVTKIYTQMFSFFGKGLPISEMRPVERSGNFTFYRGIHDFLYSPIFEKNNAT